MKNEFIIREAKEKDVAAINEIVNEAIRTSCSNWAWNERSYENALEWFHEHNTNSHCVFVAEADGKAVGYGSLSAFRSKKGYWPVVENSVYIDKDFRGRKIGTALMEALIERAEKCGLWAISAWIDSGNIESIDMHKKFGFYIAGEMKNVGDKLGEKRSVTIMQLDFEDAEVKSDNG